MEALPLSKAATWVVDGGEGVPQINALYLSHMYGDGVVSAVGGITPYLNTRYRLSGLSRSRCQRSGLERI